MENIKDGGPAFPHEAGYDYRGERVVSTRDYFAAKAMEAWIPVIGAKMGEIWTEDSAIYETVAHLAYGHADAMLAEREKGA